MNIDKRLVLQFEDGQMSFRHINHAAGFEQLLNLAEALNRFQEDAAQGVLLVTVSQF